MTELRAPAKFVTVRKSKFLVDDNNYHYTINQVTDSVSFWKCRRYTSDKCYARAITEKDGEMMFLKKVTGNHTHSSMILKNRVDSIHADYVKNASQNPTIPCRTVLADIASALQNDSLAAATSMPNMNTLKQQIYRTRRKEQGEEKIPTSVEDLLNLDDAYTMLPSGEIFLTSANQLKGDGDVSLIFMSEFGRRMLNNSKDWYMDGTFSTVPCQFSQL